MWRNRLNQLVNNSEEGYVYPWELQRLREHDPKAFRSLPFAARRRLQNNGGGRPNGSNRPGGGGAAGGGGGGGVGMAQAWGQWTSTGCVKD